ncbi:CARDB domain-containing protein [Pyxidicoccus sp. 3LFB2]
MKTLKPAGRATPLWLVMGLLAGAGCGSAGSPPAEDPPSRAQSGRLEPEGPDLVVTELKGPASVRRSEAFRATVTVCNQGTESASGTYSQPRLELYLSMDTTLTPSVPGSPQPPDQQLIGSVELRTLSPGECSAVEVNASAQLPDAAPFEGAVYLGAIVDANQEVPEPREDNNSFVGGLLGVGHLPDLVVTQLQAPASVMPGHSFVAQVKVCNQGTDSAGGGPRVELYLSTDNTLTSPFPGGPPPPDQQLVGFVGLPHLEAGQCGIFDVHANASPPPAALADAPLYLGAIVDTSHDVQELREDNNTFIGGLMGVGHRPDLVVTQLSGPASVRHGDLFSATVRLCNQGTMPSYASYGNRLELYLSMDTTLSASGPGMPQPGDQRMIASVDVPHLEPGQCATREVSAHADRPQDAPYEGVLYLAAIVDATHGVQELREDNNSFVGGLMGLGDRPDLVVTEVKGPPSSHANAAFTATVRVCNQGTAPSYGFTSSLGLYLSLDATLAPSGPGTPQPGDQQQIGFASVPMLEPGECTTLSVQAQASLPPASSYNAGVVFLGAIVDVSSSVQELREDNNSFVGGLMGVGSGADLVVTEATGPASVRPGEAFTATVKVCNQGTESSGQSSWSPARLVLFQSVFPSVVIPVPGQSTPMPQTQQVIALTTLNPLGAGQCETLSVPAQTPSGSPIARAVYLGAFVDPDRYETELREDNNVFIGGLMGLGMLPDLVITQVSGPPSVERHASFVTSVRVCNQGTEPSYPSMNAGLHVYLSTTATVVVPTPGMPPMPPLHRTQSLVGAIGLPMLAAGECQVLTVPGTASPPSDMPYDSAGYLSAVVDVTAEVDELREDNNVLSGGLMGVGNRPDLVVTSLSAPTSLPHGGFFTASVEVCNQGTAPSQDSPLELYLSIDTTLNLSESHSSHLEQSRLGAAYVPPLAPGQCTTVQLPVLAFPPPDAQVPGLFYLGAYVDPNGYEWEFREDNNARADFALEVTW